MLRSNNLNCTGLPEMTCVNMELAEMISYLATTSEERLPAKQPFMFPHRFIGFAIILRLLSCSVKLHLTPCTSEQDENFYRCWRVHVRSGQMEGG